MANSTISGNSAVSGGGIYSAGTTLLFNSTVSGNDAGGEGGGISLSPTSILTASGTTFYGNSASVGKAIFASSSIGNESTLYLAGNLFAGGSNCEIYGTFNDNGYNLSDDATCTNGGTGSATNATLNLGALADNGGPTLTHLPGAGSAVIGAIPNGTAINNNTLPMSCNNTTTDQTGSRRPLSAGINCTSGAVEVQLCPSWIVTTADELYDCIRLANANESPSPTPDTITLGADITLSTDLPQVTTAITLEGAGYTIDAGADALNGVERRIFYVTSVGNLTVNQVTLQNGYIPSGGAIRNEGGTVMVSSSTFSGNRATGDGSAIANDGGTVTITNSTFSDNRAIGDGGGIYNSNNGTVTVTNSTFSANRATGDGGGIHNSNNGVVTVTNSTFSVNRATGRDRASSYGGGIYNGNNGTVRVTNSTFSGNWATGDVRATGDGGGIYNDTNGTVRVTNSTFSGNWATGAGGGIYNLNTAYLAGTIFAAGPNGGNCVNGGGTITDNGYNLSDDDSCGFSDIGSANNATLPLGDLADNGGSTQTHLPSAGNDAVGAIPNGTTISNNGSSWTCDQSTTDQRGELRPNNGGEDCTAGAVEVAMSVICPSWTVTTADELYGCIRLANNNESPNPTADTITLGADITLSTALPQITSEIALEGANHFIDGGGSVRVFNVTVSGDFTVNQATLQNGSADYGGGISNYGMLTVTNSTLSGNNATDEGGGIANYGMLTVANSTFSENSAYDGGGIENYDTANVINSTFSGNVAESNGGGIGNYGNMMTVTNSTFYNNVGLDANAIMNHSSDKIYLANNIFALNNGSNCNSRRDPFIDNGYNLSDDTSCINGGTGSVTNATLNLGALADNGGPTLTHLPGAGSDAIGVIPSGTTINNNGTSWTCDQSTTDQRGELRPLNSGDACTAGAVEVAPICTSWTVTTAAELSDCITLANANESPNSTTDIIILGADITLSTALPQITSKITLEGANYVIDGGGSVRIFYVTSTGNLTVNQATLQNGSATHGGGIYNIGALTVTNSTIANNSATDYGGGIFHNSNETLTVTSSTLTGNTSTLYGGGIFIWRGTLTVTNSTISDNSADISGGGISNLDTATVTNGTFSGNTSDFGSSIYSRGTLTVTNSTFSGNTANNRGGIYNEEGFVTVTNSTFSGNLARDSGGGIFSWRGTLTVTNSTFSSNSANNRGGSIYKDLGTAHLAGNIFEQGISGGNCYNNGGTLYDNGYNLSDDATCTNSGTGSATNATLNLGALADNGGPTLTHLPGAGSDAIGAIHNGTTISNNGTTWTCDQSATDQRGELRPINASTACTAGAVEVARVQLTMQMNGFFSWLPAPSGSCSESLYRSSTPYVGHTWLTDDPANYDGSGSLTSVAINYFYYLLVDCGGSQSQSNEVGEFTFAIVPGG